MEPFSSRLKWLRESKGLSQRDMAEKLSLSQPYYGRFERNQGEPNLETLAKLPEILGESVDFLIGVVNYTKEINKLLERLIILRNSIKFAEESIVKFDGSEPEDIRENYFYNFDNFSNEVVEVETKLRKLYAQVPMGEKKEDKKDSQ